jgi:hypothetical protein
MFKTRANQNAVPTRPLQLTMSLALLLTLALPRSGRCAEANDRLVNPVSVATDASPLPAVSPLEPLATPPAVPFSTLESWIAPPAAVPAGGSECGDCQEPSVCACRGTCPCSGSPGICGCVSEHWHAHCKPCLQASHWGYPEYFCERRFGTLNSHVFRAMIVNGMRDQLVLYHYDFGIEADAGRLRPRGVQQLHRMAGRIPMIGSPVVIQASGDPQLDTQRQEHVLAAFAALGMELGPDMVVVDQPPVRGLDGPEAIRTHTNLLEQTRLRGNVGIETSGLRSVGYGSNSIGSGTPSAAPISGN